ncbi:MAG: hypothetical protein H7A46_10310 [Verrucomicrobiales bacterium]|nr:hypothetical protein [Verrucomicrobiales bacterium]
MNSNQTTSGRDWLRRLLACNPFYLCSAALLLWGVHLISQDTTFLPRETSQLAFNFSAVQVYEILLVLTAVWLGRRTVWYDSTLLVGLETGLLLVPFILVSQAALIDAGWVWGFCGAGLAMAFARGAAVRFGLPRLNVPPRFLILAGTVLLVNAVLPVVYRTLHESKAGTRPDFGAAFWTNEVVWLAGLPLLVAALALLPPPRARNDLIPGRRWLPAAFLGTLLLSTSVHLWSLGYVYDFAVRRDLVAPGAWMLAWMLNLRLKDFVPNPGGRLRTALLLLPAMAALLPVKHAGDWLPALLAGINLVVYGTLAWERRQLRVAVALMAGSLGCLLASLPLPVAWGAAAGWGDTERWGGATVALGLLAAMVWRHSLAGLLGSLALAAGLSRVLVESPLRDHWIVQGALVFLLVHSLRWNLAPAENLALLRRVLAGGWALHSMVMIGRTDADWLVSLVGLGVCLAWGIAYWRGATPPALSVLLAAATVSLGTPILAVGRTVAQAPRGVLILVGSLALFGLGTALALNRSRRDGGSGIGSPPELPPQGTHQPG